MLAYGFSEVFVRCISASPGQFPDAFAADGQVLEELVQQEVFAPTLPQNGRLAAILHIYGGSMTYEVLYDGGEGWEMATWDPESGLRLLDLDAAGFVERVIERGFEGDMSHTGLVALAEACGHPSPRQLVGTLFTDVDAP